jgi:hypothetical protein
MAAVSADSCSASPSGPLAVTRRRRERAGNFRRDRAMIGMVDLLWHHRRENLNTFLAVDM